MEDTHKINFHFSDHNTHLIKLKIENFKLWSWTPNCGHNIFITFRPTNTTGAIRMDMFLLKWMTRTRQGKIRKSDKIWSYNSRDLLQES
jgi:hypothetical protein